MSQEEQDKAAREAADKAAIAEDNQRKTDLNEGADAHVDDGKGDVPVKVDPFEGRKSIFKKNRNHREERINREAQEHEAVARSRQVMEDEAAQGSSRNELDRGDHIDTNAPGRFDTAARREQLEREAAGNHQGEDLGNDDQRLNGDGNVPHQNGASGDERVKVKVLGQEFEVPQRDIDEAGGVAAYQKDRAATMRLQSAAKREAELKEQQAAFQQEREQWNQQRDSAGRNAPAKVPGSTPGTAPIQKDGAGDGADVEEQAEAIARDLYSGDPKRAKAAIAKIIQNSTTPVAQLDPEDLARQAAELLKKQDNGKPEPTKQPVDVAVSVEIKELNDMMSLEYRALLDDPDMKAKALAKFEALRADPANKYRRLVDMGREAAKAAQAEGEHPRKDILERKRTLPPTASGSRVHRPSDPAPISNSSYVERMRKARGLPG